MQVSLAIQATAVFNTYRPLPYQLAELCANCVTFPSAGTGLCCSRRWQIGCQRDALFLPALSEGTMVTVLGGQLMLGMLSGEQCLAVSRYLN